MSAEWTRRRMLAALAGSAGATLAGAVIAEENGSAEGALESPQVGEPSADPTRQPGMPASELGERSPFETLRRLPVAGVISGTPLQDLHGMLTPSDLHFERHHAGIPKIDPGFLMVAGEYPCETYLAETL